MFLVHSWSILSTLNNTVKFSWSIPGPLLMGLEFQGHFYLTVLFWTEHVPGPFLVHSKYTSQYSEIFLVHSWSTTYGS